MLTLPLLTLLLTIPDGSPPPCRLADTMTFRTTREGIKAAQKANRQAAAYFQAEFVVHGCRGAYGAILDDLDRRHVAYELLDDALWGGFGEERRMQALERLREMLGWSDYYEGRMPCPIDPRVYRELP